MSKHHRVSDIKNKQHKNDHPCSNRNYCDPYKNRELECSEYPCYQHDNININININNIVGQTGSTGSGGGGGGGGGVNLVVFSFPLEQVRVPTGAILPFINKFTDPGIKNITSEGGTLRFPAGTYTFSYNVPVVPPNTNTITSVLKGGIPLPGSPFQLQSGSQSPVFTVTFTEINVIQGTNTIQVRNDGQSFVVDAFNTARIRINVIN